MWLPIFVLGLCCFCCYASLVFECLHGVVDCPFCLLALMFVGFWGKCCLLRCLDLWFGWGCGLLLRGWCLMAAKLCFLCVLLSLVS